MSLKVLLIEPDKRLAEIYAKALEVKGHIVRHASSAQSAIHQSETDVPDLIILEPQLAEHDGVEFLYELRSYTDWQTVPVIIHSFIQPEILRLSATVLDKLAVIDCLYKPQTSLQQLLRAVRV